MFVLEEEDRVLYDRIQEHNLARQYDLLINCIEIGVIQGVRAFDKYMLWSLNGAAVSNISQFGGRFREEPIYLADHIPPHFSLVPHLMDQFISTVQENWFVCEPYYEALREADRAWHNGQLSFPKMEAYLARLLDEQVLDMPLPMGDGRKLPP